MGKSTFLVPMSLIFSFNSSFTNRIILAWPCVFHEGGNIILYPGVERAVVMSSVFNGCLLLYLEIIP